MCVRICVCVCVVCVCQCLVCKGGGAKTHSFTTSMFKTSMCRFYDLLKTKLTPKRKVNQLLTESGAVRQLTRPTRRIRSSNSFVPNALIHGQRSMCQNSIFNRNQKVEKKKGEKKDNEIRFPICSFAVELRQIDKQENGFHFFQFFI